MLLVSDYVNDIYSYLYHLETVYAIRSNHLEGQRDVFPKMRSVLIDWINEVHLQYRFAQETFHMAVSIIDRFLQVLNLQTITDAIQPIVIINNNCLYRDFSFILLGHEIDNKTKFTIGWRGCSFDCIQI